MIPHAGRSNRSLSVLLICFICSVVLLTGSIGVEPATAQKPDINATVGGDRLVQDGEITVLEDPSANVTVTSDTPIKLVEVRVNGEIRRSYRPNETAFSRAVSLDLDPNENTVEIIAQSSSIKSLQTTITKHTAAPRVQYSSPFSTSIKGGPSNETNLSSGQVTLAGSLHTVSTVEQIRIERTHRPEANNSSRELYQIRNPGESFSQELLLGVGTNEVVAEYTDANGRTNTDTFRLIVDDATDPTIDLDSPNSSYTDSTEIRGTVRDETKLKKVSLNRTSNNASQVLLLSSDDEPDANRLSYAIDMTVDLFDDNDDNEFKIVAEDAAGNVQTRTFSLNYEPEPQVTITENTTNRTANTVQVAGEISEAEIDRVTVETINTQSGDRLDLARVYDAGTPTTTLEFDRTLRATPDHTVVKLLIEYEDGQQTRTIQPSIATQQEVDETEVDSPSNRSDAVTDAETGSNISATNSDEGGVNATTDSTKEDTTPDSQSSPPTLIPIRTRDAFGGTVIVGAIYLLGHRV